jgi:hypothetical protein
MAEEVQFTRRALMRATSFTFLLGAGLPEARASQRHALYGRWYLQCPKDGVVDAVDDGTKQHHCSKCDTQVFVNGSVTVVCKSGHPNLVDLSNTDVLSSYACKTCGVDCQGAR